MSMQWQLSHRCDPVARVLADRHYNRQSIGAANFVPPGRCLVLRTPEGDAVWVTSWPFAEYVRHKWAGAWVNSLFRNESPHKSSELIRQAIAATRWYWPDVPSLGMVTFVDSAQVTPKDLPGYCYLRARFRHCGHTEGGLVALRMLPHRMPAAEPPIGATMEMPFVA